MASNTGFHPGLHLYVRVHAVIKSCKTIKQLEGALRYLSLAWDTDELSLFEHKRLKEHYFNQIDLINETRQKV